MAKGKGTESEKSVLRVVDDRSEYDVDFGCCEKYSLLVFNAIFMFVGALLLAAGIWARIEKVGHFLDIEKFDINEEIMIFDPASIIAIVGGVLAIVGYFGLIGALRDNCLFLTIYIILIGSLIIVEIGCIVAAMLSGRLMVTLSSTKISDTIILYREDADLQNFIDWIQITFECCGSLSPNDWDQNIYFSGNKRLRSFGSPEANGVPFSCCKNTSTTSAGLHNIFCGHETRQLWREDDQKNSPVVSRTIHENGCVTQVAKFLYSNALYLVAVIGLAILLQIMCLLMSCSHRSEIFTQRDQWYDLTHVHVEKFSK